MSSSAAAALPPMTWLSERTFGEKPPASAVTNQQIIESIGWELDSFLEDDIGAQQEIGW